jgi:hypothetical protein
MEVLTRSLLSVAWMSLATLTAACGAAGAPPSAGSGTSKPEVGTSATMSASGDAAVWFVKPGQTLQASSTRFTALVSRLGCNSGVTGHVLAPEIHLTRSEVVVTFAVAPKQSDAGTCPSNDEVAYEVVLGEPLQGRALVDGQCRPGGEAATTSFCDPESTRFKP